MAAPQPIMLPIPVQGVPYVGLRPFEPHERDRFFGRERDAQILCDRILSTRLTILYALSGLGKSSLLRALVIPKLEENHAWVFYFDNWSHADPCQALKSSLATCASQAGMPKLDSDSLSLVEIARLLSSNDGRGLVLVLDQFEEFLVRNAQNLDPLRSELAALVRASELDVAIVLTLREEFLASLEPFRQQILNLFQSAFRLESLADNDLCKAIREPARVFGGDCEPEFVKELIHDLQGESVNVSAGPQLSLGLPMLQLVCQELWRQAPNHQLAMDLYTRMGRTEGIINEYVRALMPKERAKQNATASLLIYLAPPSGLKMSYSVEDLAGITNLPTAGINAELQRLEEARILRTRAYAAGVRYELQHDAFIPVLRSWREEVLEKKRHRERQKRVVRVALILCLFLFLATLGLRWKHQEQLEKVNSQLAIAQEELKRQKDEAEHVSQMNKMKFEKELMEARAKKIEDWQAGGLLDDLRNKSAAERAQLASGYFDILVDVLLHKRGKGNLGLLREKLRQNEDLVPLDYDNRADVVVESEASAEEPLIELQYSSAREAVDPQITGDPHVFAGMWRALAKDFSAKWAVPVPTKVSLVRNEHVPADHLWVKASKSKVSATDLQIPVYQNRFLVSSSVASIPDGPARRFLENYHSDWSAFPERPEWQLVPRWSVPVWKAAGVHATAPGGIDAYLVIDKLSEQPEPLLYDDAIQALLLHVRERFPQTVDEARRARGDALPEDLRAKVRERNAAMLALPQILDQLADLPPSKDEGRRDTPTANRASVSTQRDTTQTKRTLQGPWKLANAEEPNSNYMASLGEHERLRFMELVSQLPEYLPIRVQVGSRLVPELFPRDDLSEELKKALEDLRNEIYRSYGVTVPGYRFRESTDSGLPPDAIFIEVQGDQPWNSGVQRLSGPNTLNGLVTVLRSADEHTLTRWITAENTQEIVNRLPPNVRKQLETSYCLTDLKRLLRQVVRPAQSGAHVPAASDRYPIWLLDSLVFWMAVSEDPLDIKAMADHLRETEAAALKPRATETTSHISANARQHLEQGINALADDNPKSANIEFSEAKQLDPNGAIALFPALWSQRLPELWLREFRRAHANLDDMAFASDAERLDLKDLSIQIGSARDPLLWREAMLYRLASSESDRSAAESKTMTELLTHIGPATDWAPDDASWLALRFLRQYDPLDAAPGNSEMFASASTLLVSAVERFPDQDRAHRVFLDVNEIVRSSAAPEKVSQLLDRLADARPGGAQQNLQLERAWELCGEERSDRLQRALVLVQNYGQIVATTQLKPEERQLALENINYVKAKSYAGLVRQGHEQYFSEAERLLRGMLNSSNTPIAQEINLTLVQLLYENGKLEQAESLNHEAQVKWPDEAEFLGAEMVAQLRSGNPSGMQVATRRAKQKALAASPNDETNAAWLYLAALGSILTEPGSAESQELVKRFLATNHEYRDYILMIDYAFASPKNPAGIKRLKERWAEIKPQTWLVRLRNGDASAWRELLIGRFMGAAESAKLLDVLQHEDSWQASEFSQLSEPLRGQRCEAWFYDALTAHSRGSREHMRDSLHRAVETKYVAYYEYGMAAYLLSQEQGNEENRKH